MWLTEDLPVWRQGMASGQVWALTHRTDRDEEDRKLMADPVYASRAILNLLLS